MTSKEWKNINRLINAWILACRKLGKDNMDWADQYGIKGRDARYLFQLYFKKLKAMNNSSDPKLTAKGMTQLNLMWKHVHSYFNPSFNHNKELSDRRRYKREYEKEVLEY